MKYSFTCDILDDAGMKGYGIYYIRINIHSAAAGKCVAYDGRCDISFLS